MSEKNPIYCVHMRHHAFCPECNAQCPHGKKRRQCNLCGDLS